MLPNGFRRLRCVHHAAVVGRLGAAWISLLTMWLSGRGAPALSLPTARCRRARAGLAGAQARAGTGASGADATFLVGSSCQLFSSHAVDRCAPTSTSLPCPPCPMPQPASVRPGSTSSVKAA